MPGLWDMHLSQLRFWKMIKGRVRALSSTHRNLKERITLKKTASIILTLLLVAALAACGGKGGQGTLTVFAAASMQEAMTEIGAAYMALHPDTVLAFNFDSSGALQTQIQEGADCDIFISAGQKQMDQLDAAANTEGLDFVLEGSRVDLLENKVALAVPEGNPKGVGSFDELAELLKNGEVLLAIGNSDVPVGQYTQKIFAFYGLDETALNAAGKLTYGSNVKEVTTHISEGAADCGIIYATDAFSAGLTVADTAVPEMCGPVVYPAAVVKNSGNPDEAQAFLEYVRCDRAAGLGSLGV